MERETHQRAIEQLQNYLERADAIENPIEREAWRDKLLEELDAVEADPSDVQVDRPEAPPSLDP